MVFLRSFTAGFSEPFWSYWFRYVCSPPMCDKKTKNEGDYSLVCLCNTSIAHEKRKRIPFIGLLMFFFFLFLGAHCWMKRLGDGAGSVVRIDRPFGFDSFSYHDFFHNRDFLSRCDVEKPFVLFRMWPLLASTYLTSHEDGDQCLNSDTSIQTHALQSGEMRGSTGVPGWAILKDEMICEGIWPL